MIKVIVHVAKAAVAVITALLCFSCGFEAVFKNVNGNGNVVTKNRPVSTSFKGISAGSGIEVVIEQGPERSITVEADDNLQQHIKTEIENGMLNISTNANIGNAKAKRVVVRLPEIEKIESTSGAQITGKNVLKGNTLSLYSSSGSNMDVAVEANNIICESSSGGKLKAIGKTGTLQTAASSGSTINAKGLIAKTVSAETSSSGKTYVNPSESLTADASSGGTIYYVNAPAELNKQTSSGGSIAKE